MVIGIDPGKNGAIALVHSETEAQIYDTPTEKLKLGGQEYKISAMFDLLLSMVDRGAKEAFVEDVHTFRGDGVVGAFSFGRGVGLWHGLLVASGIAFQRVLPQRWQKHFGMTDTNGVDRKTMSRQVASAMYPKLSPLFTRVKDHDRAEALLIGRYGLDNANG